MKTKEFDRNGINIITGTEYDTEGYDKNGYNKYGYDRQGFNKNGYTEDEVKKMEINGVNPEDNSIDKKVLIPIVLIPLIIIVLFLTFFIHYINDFKPSDRKIIKFVKKLYPNTEFSVEYENGSKSKIMGSCDGSPIDRTMYYHYFSHTYIITNLDTGDKFSLRYVKEIPHRKELCMRM